MPENKTLLKNQIIFISGACGLIGKRFVDVCLNAGASVIAADINAEKLSILSKSALSKPASPQQVKKHPEKLLTIPVDLTSAKELKQALEASINTYGSITAVINAAYPRNKHYGRHFFEVEHGDFCENLNLNIGSTFLSCQTFARYFKTQGQGNIINLGSIYGMMAPDFDIYPDSMTTPVEYAAIKSAVIHLTRYMAQLLRKEGIRVNCISPGGISDSQPTIFLEKYNAKCGLQGMLNTEHLDSTLLYLLSANSNAVTGQNIVVDDGFSL